jgi:hypothetical protein
LEILQHDDRNRHVREHAEQRVDRRYDAGDLTSEPLVSSTSPGLISATRSRGKQIEVRIKLAVVASCVFVNGDGDLPNACATQEGLNLPPLSVSQKNVLSFERSAKVDCEHFVYTPSATEALRMYNEIGFELPTFPIPRDDYSDPEIGQVQQIGLCVAECFEWHGLDEPQAVGNL